MIILENNQFMQWIYIFYGTVCLPERDILCPYLVLFFNIPKRFLIDLINK